MSRFKRNQSAIECGSINTGNNKPNPKNLPKGSSMEITISIILPLGELETTMTDRVFYKS